MINRKDIKKAARLSLKNHYLLFLLVCLIAAFIGSEFRGSLILTDGIEQSLYTDISDTLSKVSNENNININIDSSNVIETINENLEPFKSSEITKTITDTITEKVEPINENLKSLQETTKNDALKLKGEKGFFAKVVDSISSSNIILTLTKGILSIVHSENIAFMIAIIFAILFWLAFTVFVIELYRVIERRIFLEGRLYKYIPSDHFTFIFKVKKVIRASFSMFIVSIKKIMWLFTIVMYPIKYYEYYMVPYILAENPTLSSKEAIKISKELMKGYKWQTFIFELTFIGWDLLGYITLGIINVFYTNPYKMCSFSELYAYLRKNATLKNDNLNTYLNDKYLFEKASSDVIHNSYLDIKKYKDNAKVPNIQIGKFRKFLLNFLGINTISANDTEKYEKYMVKKLKSEEYDEEMNLEAYPTRLSALEIKERKTKIIDNINYLKPYKITSLLSMFFIMCFIGWTWEVILNIITTGEFVNKGMLHGPWLPIYGSGGLLILTILYKFRNSPKKEFLTTILLCGTVEYFSGLVIELTHNGKKWWDYNGYFLNISGRICAEGLIAFGIGGIIIVYFAAPLLDNLIKKINKKVLILVLSILLTIFVMDIFYSKNNPNTGKGITDYSKCIIINKDIKT